VEVSQRAKSYIENNFSPSESRILENELASLEGEVSERGGEFSERIASSIIILAKRNFDNLGRVITSTKSDWRDVLLASGLDNDDWRLGVEALLGPHT